MTARGPNRTADHAQAASKVRPLSFSCSETPNGRSRLHVYDRQNLEGPTLDFNQGFAIMHDRSESTPPSGRNDCSQVQTARDTPIILTLLRAAVWMCLHDASCGLIVRDAAGQALGYFNFDEEPGRPRRRSGVRHAGSKLKLPTIREGTAWESQPSSRTGENPPYGMIGRIEETLASFEARSAPRPYPTTFGPADIRWVGCELFCSDSRRTEA